MKDGPWDVVVFGIAVHQGTHEVREVRMGWSGETGAWFLECGGRVLSRDEGDPAAMERYTALIFGEGSGGGASLDTVCDPINLDGSPRNKLRHPVAQRGLDLEAMAAD
jgi:hypothetical protein